ncbi:hypothetical protein [Lederbergia ruris]|nr:hypothetical protein [Lederbergia ruris]
MADRSVFMQKDTNLSTIKVNFQLKNATSWTVALPAIFERDGK